jgi:hypothetical protein
MLKQWLQKQERLATRPPLWYRAVSVLLVPVVILGALVFDHTAIGWIAGTFFGSIILLQAIKPGAAARLGRNHPRLDGAFLGLPLFFGLAVLTPIPLWICAVIGVVGIAVGVALGCSPAATADNRPEVIGVKPASQGTGWE